MKLKYIDPRHIQIFNNITMMVYGYLYLNFNRDYKYLPLTFVISLAIDFILSRYLNKERNQRSLVDRATSIVNTMASVYVMVNIDNPMFYLVAITFAILSKFLFRVKNEHVFNPANCGIVLSLLLVSDTYVRIIYTQFANPSSFIFWFVVVNGMIITIWAKRLVLAVTYMFATSLFLYIISPFFYYANTFLIGPTFSTSGLLFAFFMITDPRTTPHKWQEQVIFGCVAALIGAFIRANQMVHDAFIALFLTTALYSIIRYQRISLAEARAAATT